MKQRLQIAVSLLLGALGLIGCRKDLCYNHDEHSPSVKVHAVASWELEWERTYHPEGKPTDVQGWEELWHDAFRYTYDDLRPQPATGIRAIAYGTDDYYSEANLPSEGGRLPLREGLHEVLLYNNDTEYIVFDSLKASVSAVATTRSVTRSSLAELHSGERTMNQPDQLYGYYQEECIGEKTLEKVELPVTLRPLTYTYLIRYEFSKGLEYVALARGALAGMAEKVYLNDGHTDGSAATLLFDCELTDFGADVCMQSFGVPNYPGDHYTRADGTPAYYTLNLEVRLNNGKMLSYDFDVTDQVNAQPRGGVITVSGIEVSDEDGTEGGGGFDVSVDGWGEWVDVPLPLD